MTQRTADRVARVSRRETEAAEVVRSVRSNADDATQLFVIRYRHWSWINQRRKAAELASWCSTTLTCSEDPQQADANLVFSSTLAGVFSMRTLHPIKFRGDVRLNVGERRPVSPARGRQEGREDPAAQVPVAESDG
ncbi:unnamed protein product [Pleuronectes platessa]|uniref:Uncharacterized protein n=1 Tax=Pleuronectes platessa TaxID=8262 RepID=A0A9N7TNR7_PLEPL|nr:unnamed protein product [Pleuronectes platessa]